MSLIVVGGSVLHDSTLSDPGGGDLGGVLAIFLGELFRDEEVEDDRGDASSDGGVTPCALHAACAASSTLPSSLLYSYTLDATSLASPAPSLPNIFNSNPPLPISLIPLVPDSFDAIPCCNAAVNFVAYFVSNCNAGSIQAKRSGVT